MISEITTAVFLLLCGLAIFRMGQRSGIKLERSKKPAPITPTCPCSHTWGAHKEGGKCNAAVKRTKYSRLGSNLGHEWSPCACTKYHGPKIIDDQFFHPGTYTS